MECDLLREGQQSQAVAAVRRFVARWQHRILDRAMQQWAAHVEASHVAGQAALDVVRLFRNAARRCMLAAFRTWQAKTHQGLAEEYCKSPAMLFSRGLAVVLYYIILDPV